MKKLLFLSCFLLIFAMSSPSRATLFYDDFESGMGNWTQFPGGAGALEWDNSISIVPASLGNYSAYQRAYVGGGNGYSSYHNFGDVTGFLKAEVYIYEDLNNMSYSDPVQGGMTLTTQNTLGEPDFFIDFLRIGILQSSGSNTVYSFRTRADNFSLTTVERKSGWTKLGIEADSGVGADVRFYIDDVLVGTSSRVSDSFACIQMGQNFSNYVDFWYDGVSVTNEYAPVVPVPATMLLLGSGLVGLAGLRKQFRKS